MEEIKDIFDYLHVGTKEDKYTFCLEAFLEESEDYRAVSAKFWGFSDGEYHVFRKAIELEKVSSSGRKKIVPDLILYNEKHIAVIESKMYAKEGWGQTKDYEDSDATIRKRISDEKGINLNNSDINYYFFTLAGIKAASNSFQVVPWAKYYSETLGAIEFKNESLELLRRSILARANEFLDFEQNYKEKSYVSMFPENGSSWICPMSLFSSGLLNDAWGLGECGTDKTYDVSNGIVNGQGHSTFKTDITYNAAWGKVTDIENDNIFLFTRIEWKKDEINVFLNWEYWKRVGGEWMNYIPYSKLKDMSDLSSENRKKCVEYLMSILPERNKELNGQEIMAIPFAKNMLHMVKMNIPTESKTIGMVVEEVKEILTVYAKISKDLCDRLVNENGHLVFRK